MPCYALVIVLLLALVCTVAPAAPAVTGLTAQYRDGQVFLTWEEPAGLEGTLTVWIADRPITAETLAGARIVADRLNPGSAADWWLNPETYGNPVKPDPQTGQKPPYPHEGFLLRAGGQELKADSGLHVHTVTADDPAPAYYAVTTRDAAGTENRELAAGGNSLREPVAQQVGAVQPIWQREGAPDVAAGKGLPLHLVLHAKTGNADTNYLAFGDASLGWREGLPFKFGVRVTPQAVIVSPVDRTWIGRMFPEGKDGCQKLTPALHSFWYGYNNQINDPAKMDEGVATDFTERRVLWILRWVQQTYGTDVNRTYATGSSMGGCGMMSFAFRHPEIFAGLYAHVPIVAYDKGAGGDSTVRVTAECGPLDRICSEGLPLGERLDARLFAQNHKGDLPFLLIVNGRNDKSIPWWKNPDFYRTMRDCRQAFVAAWNDGDHASTGSKIPADIRQLGDLNSLHYLALNKSYLAFSNSSQDQDPGNGEATSGDVEGYLNRGLGYGEPVDEAGRYEVTVKWSLEADKLPVAVDITPRRLQAFKLKPGEAVSAANLDAEGKEVQRLELTADGGGLVTVKQFRITSAAGNKLVLTRK